MASQEEFDFETDCSIGDLEYDSDMQITRLYVKVYQGKASLKELERLFNYYRNKVLEYLDLTTAMLKFLKQAREDIITYMLYDIKSLNIFIQLMNKETISSSRALDVKNRILNNFSVYFGLIRLTSFGMMDTVFFDTKKLNGEYIEVPDRGEVNITDLYLPGCTDEYIDTSEYLDKSTYSLLVDFLIPYVYDRYNSDEFKKCSWYKFAIGETYKTMEYINITPVPSPNIPKDFIIPSIIGRKLDRELRKDYDENNYPKELDYIYGITNCVEMLKIIADWNCLSPEPHDVIPMIESNFYLPNNTGFFGFNTYLWALYNGVKIIGVPSTFPQYDGIEGDCPSRFIDHDLEHGYDINAYRNNIIENTKPIYYRLISDTELTLQQKKLMILTIWILIHENFSIDVEFKTSTMLNELDITIDHQDFFPIFNSFRNLILTPEIFEDTSSNFKTLTLSREHKLNSFESKNHLVELNSLTQQIHTYDDLRDIIDDNSIKIKLRGEFYWFLCLYYTKSMIEKYYSDLVT